MCGTFIKLSSILPISFLLDTVWCALAVDNPALRCDSVGFNLAASQSTEPPKPRSLVHIQLFQLHRIIVLSRSYQEVLSIPLDWSLGEYKFGASSSYFAKPEGKTQRQRRQSPEVPLFESLELNPLLSVLVTETIRFFFFFSPKVSLS